MMMSSTTSTTCLLLGLVVATGCASFRGDRMGAVPAASEAQWKPSVSIAITGEARLGGKERDLPIKALEHYRDLTKQAYEESGYFSPVRIGLEESDIRAEVEIINRGVANQALAFLSGFTLLILPAKATDIFTIETRFVGRDGVELGRFERTEAVTTWFELFLIFLSPFAWPTTVVSDVIVDLNQAVLHDAAAHGVFEQPTSQ